jgi:hypothetical protein
LKRGPKKVHHNKRGGKTLARRCLEDGTLDVCLETGMVTSFAQVETGKLIRPRLDEDGYRKFTLVRSVSARLVKKKRADGCRIWQMTVFVHRLAMMKKIAVKKAKAVGTPDEWRAFVRDLPAGLDVNHKNLIRDDNRACNLELQTERTNRNGQPSTEEELRSIAEFETGDPERWREYLKFATMPA